MLLKISGFIGLVVLVIALAFFYPALKSQWLAQTFQVTSGKNLKIEKRVTPYQDWNTGSPSETVTYSIFFQGARLGMADLKALVDKTASGILQNPTVYDAVEMKPDDVLLAVSKDGQSSTYSIVRLRAVASSDSPTLEATILEKGAGESAYNWFPKSRVDGWTRIVGSRQDTFMVRHQPFQVVALGDGDLVKADLPYVFVASDSNRRAQLSLRVHRLDDGKAIASLELRKECFALPRFTIDHPKIDELGEHVDETVSFDHSQAWWDRNFDFSTESSLLTLRPSHSISAPASRRIAIVDGENEIDSFQLTSADCAKVNPRGAELAKGRSTELALSLTPAEFCLGSNWKTVDAVQKQACGLQKRQSIFRNGSLGVNQVSLTYRPGNPQAKPVTVEVPELEFAGKRFNTVKNPNGEGELLIQEVVLLNPDQLLLKSRREGPWIIHLVTAQKEKAPTVQAIGEFAFPGTPFEATADESYFYSRAAAVLVRRVPFGYLEQFKGLLSIQSDRAASFYLSDDDKTVTFVVWKFDLGAEMKASEIWLATIARSCFNADFPVQSYGENSTPVAVRETWFAKNLRWSETSAALELQKPAEGSCRLQQKKN